jgi:hypothetical protein
MNAEIMSCRVNIYGVTVDAAIATDIHLENMARQFGGAQGMGSVGNQDGFLHMTERDALCLSTAYRFESKRGTQLFLDAAKQIVDKGIAPKGSGVRVEVISAVGAYVLG